MPHTLIAHFRPDMVSGAERAIADVVGEMSASFPVTMLTPGEGPLADFYRERGFEVWPELIQTKRRKYPGLHTMQSIRFSKKLRKRAVDLVICNTFAAAGRVGDAARLAGIPCVIYVREYFSDKKIHRKMLNQADKIFSVSKDVQQYVARFSNHDNIETIYDHIATGPIEDRVRKSRENGGRRIPFGTDLSVVGLIGRITPYKQQDLFIEAVPLVLKEVPDARFIVVGSAKPKEKDFELRVKSLAEDLGVGEKVIFMGQRPDAIEIMAELSALCLTSTADPFPRVILEAQVVGCPVIASGSGGVPEMIEDNTTGLLFRPVGPGSAQRLAGKIIRLLDDERLRLEIGKRAQERVYSGIAGPAAVSSFEKAIMGLQSEHVRQTNPNGR